MNLGISSLMKITQVAVLFIQFSVISINQFKTKVLPKFVVLGM